MSWGWGVTTRSNSGVTTRDLNRGEVKFFINFGEKRFVHFLVRSFSGLLSSGKLTGEDLPGVLTQGVNNSGIKDLF